MAQLHEAQRRTRMLATALQLTRLLVGEAPRTWNTVTETAARVCNRDFAVLLASPPDGDPVMICTAGTLPQQLTGEPLTEPPRLVEAVMREARPRVVSHLQLLVGGHRQVVSVICAPLPASDAAGGALLVVGRAQGRPAFDAGDLALLTEFTADVSAAFVIDRARTQSEALRLSDDRSRIAGEVNAHVITRLFALSLELCSVARSPASDTPDRRLNAISEIDSSIKWLRETILSRGSIGHWPDPLAHQVIAAVEESGPTAGHEIRLDLSRLEVDLPLPVTEEAAAVVREALTGVHGQSAGGSTTTMIKVALEAPKIVVDIKTSGRQRDILDPAAAEHLRQAAVDGRLDIASDARDARIRWTWSDCGE